MKESAFLTRRVSSACSIATSSSSTPSSPASSLKDVESGSLSSQSSRRSRTSSTVRSMRSLTSRNNVSDQHHPKKESRRSCGRIMLTRLYVLLFGIQVLYLLDGYLLQGMVLDEYRDKLVTTHSVDDALSLWTAERQMPLTWKGLPPTSYAYLESSPAAPHFPKGCHSWNKQQNDIVSLVWAYDDPPDVQRFVDSLAHLQDTKVEILCGSTECMTRARQAATVSNCVAIRRLNVIDYLQETPLQSWAENHVLAKLLAAHHYEDHLQIAVQLAALYKKGGAVLQPGITMSNKTNQTQPDILVGTCDGQETATSTMGGLFATIGPRKSRQTSRMMKEFLHQYKWDRPIRERYDPTHWPLEMNWNGGATAAWKGMMPLSSKDCSTTYQDGRKSQRFYATLSYDERRKFLLSRNNTGMNVGDETQGLAGIQMVPRIDAFVERDRLDKIFFTDESQQHHHHDHGDVHAFLNAWWGTPTMTWPPPENISPVALAMHFQPKVQEKVLEGATVSKLMEAKEEKRGRYATWKTSFLKRYYAMQVFLSPIISKPYVPKELTETAVPPFLKAQEPIGARDTKTLQFLRDHGVNAIFTACMTMTLSLPKTEKGEDVLVVDVNDKQQLEAVIPDTVLSNATFLTQKLVGEEAESNMIRHMLAYERLEMYAKAKLVITGRLHVGLPAAALGTPVIFVHSKHLPGGGGNRLDGLDDFMHTVRGTKGVEDFDWVNPPANPRESDFVRSMGRIKQLATCHSGISDSARKFGMMPLDWDAGDELEACPSPSRQEDPTKIHVATTVDSNFFDLVFPTWVNALAQSNPDEVIVLHVLTVDLSEKQRCLLRLMVHKLMPSCEVYTVPVDVDQFNERYQTSHFHVSIATQARLRLSSIFPCLDRVLWIDLDAFPVANLRPIYSQGVAGCGINARSSTSKYMENQVRNFKWNQMFGDGFNAGVMLLDLKKLRKHKFEEKVVQYWAIDRGFNDQVTLNMACNGTHGQFNQTMNVFQGYAPQYTPERDGWIIAHFQGSRKPWGDRFDKGQESFSKIWDQSKITFEEVLDL